MWLCTIATLVYWSCLLLFLLKINYNNFVWFAHLVCANSVSLASEIKSLCQRVPVEIAMISPKLWSRRCSMLVNDLIHEDTDQGSQERSRQAEKSFRRTRKSRHRARKSRRLASYWRTVKSRRRARKFTRVRKIKTSAGHSGKLGDELEKYAPRNKFVSKHRKRRRWGKKIFRRDGNSRRLAMKSRWQARKSSRWALKSRIGTSERRVAAPPSLRESLAS